MSRRATPETATKTAVKAFLKLNRIWSFPLVAGMASYPGAPDRICWHEGRCIAIEVKSPTGRLTAHQEVFQVNWEASGGIYLVVRSLEDLSKGLGIEGVIFG